ncbi:MAG: hypothetical protein ACLQAH_15495 [Limisphaerales bacterium]
MTTELSNFAARLRERFFVGDDVRSLKFQEPGTGTPDPNQSEPPHVGSYDKDFNRLALELFALQLKHNPAYRKICAGRKLMPGAVEHWTEIPVVPTEIFKELELASIPPAERTAVFHSSGTTVQKPSRHFHNAESLAVYEASLWSWFQRNIFANSAFSIQHSALLFLTPPPAQAPHSSLIHMFETIRSRACESVESAFLQTRPQLNAYAASTRVFLGKVADDGTWTLDFDAVLATLNSSLATRHPSLLLGTAFSFVHLLDHLAENNLRFQLPAGSRVMETGGYKNRSRSMPKTELHRLITDRFGVPPENIICEYGMSELSSQAYDLGAPASRHQLFPQATKELAGETPALPGTDPRHFSFPPWARVQIVSPETGHEVAEGETGLIRVFDLANVFSVMAIQTEDLGIRRGTGFELIGRAALAEPRGCSLMTHSALRVPHSAIA